jgi:hypothetical protein
VRASGGTANVAEPIRELRAIDPAWDAFLTPDDEWDQSRVLERVTALVDEVLGPGIGVSVATKTLHRDTLG